MARVSPEDVVTRDIVALEHVWDNTREDVNVLRLRGVQLHVYLCQEFNGSM